LPLLIIGSVIGLAVEAMLAAAGAHVRGVRNRALLSLDFDTGLRRSDLVAILWPHVERGSPGGRRLFVARSNADQEGAGPYAYLSARTMTTLEAWRGECRGACNGTISRRLHLARDKASGEIWSIGAALICAIGDTDLSRPTRRRARRGPARRF
jgi:integrase